MCATLNNHSRPFFKKIAFLFLLGSGFIILSLVVFIGFYVADKIRFVKTPITLVGIIDGAFLANKPLTNNILKTGETNYYLVDGTDKISQEQRVNETCPSGTITCYLGKLVKIDGYITEKKWSMVPIVSPYKQVEEADGVPFQAQELVVLNIEVLAN